MSFQPGANLYTAGFGLRPENIEVPHVDVRIPTTNDVLFPVGKWWLYKGNSLWYLLNQTSVGGSLQSNWVEVSGSGGSGVISVNANNGLIASPTSGSVIVSGVNATTSSVGVASFNSSDFTVSGAGQVSLASSSGFVWSDVSSNITMAVNNGYTTNSLTLLTLSLPGKSPYGSLFRIVGKGVGGWRVAQGTAQVIHFGNISTTVGSSGYIQSSQQYDSIEILCTVADTEFTVINGPQGNITYN
jgi:hypothetical protein